MTIRHLIAVDPGDKNNGFAWFKYDTETRKAETRVMDIYTPKGLSSILRTIQKLGECTSDYEEFKRNPNMHFVVENFRVDSHVRGAKFQWNEMITARMIGRVEFVAESIEAYCELQEPSILTNATKWGPWSYLPKHIPDDKSAFLHGQHYMEKKRWINSINDIKMIGQTELK